MIFTAVKVCCKITSAISLTANGLSAIVDKFVFNGAASFKNVNNYFNTNIYSYLETSNGQSSNLYLNVVHFFNTGV